MWLLRECAEWLLVLIVAIVLLGLAVIAAGLLLTLWGGFARA